MKFCRYDDDRLGVVIGDKVHDVTAAQNEIRAASRYDMMGDRGDRGAAVVARRIEKMAASTTGKPIAEVKLLPPVARPSKTDGGADQLSEAHRGDAAARKPGAERRPLSAGHR